MYSHFFAFVLLHLFLIVSVVALACVSVLQHVLIAGLHDGCWLRAASFVWIVTGI
jgi:hypothetical protein